MCAYEQRMTFGNVIRVLKNIFHAVRTEMQSSRFDIVILGFDHLLLL